MNREPSQATAGPGVIATGTLIFLHVPKTAGMTVRQVIERNYGRGERFLLPLPPRGPDAAQAARSLADVPAVRRMADLPDDRKRALRAVYGHTLFGVHGFLPGPATYFTMLREPTRRTLSEYGYLRDRSAHWLHEQVKGMSIEEYVRSAMHGRDNFQTRIISGEYFGVPVCTEETLELAKRNLDQRFGPVGLTERFDESLLIWGDAFGWKRLHYVPQNVSRRPAGEPPSPEVTRIIREMNEFDDELYRYATERFEEEVARRPSLQADVARFRRRNGLYRRVFPVSPRVAARKVKRAILGRPGGGAR